LSIPITVSERCVVKPNAALSKQALVGNGTNLITYTLGFWQPSPVMR